MDHVEEKPTREIVTITEQEIRDYCLGTDEDRRRIDAIDDHATFFAHDGIETFAELKERLKIKAKPAAGTDGG